MVKNFLYVLGLGLRLLLKFIPYTFLGLFEILLHFHILILKSLLCYIAILKCFGKVLNDMHWKLMLYKLRNGLLIVIYRNYLVLLLDHNIHEITNTLFNNLLNIYPLSALIHCVMKVL